MSAPAVLALSVSDAPFWAWWLAPVAVTVLVAAVTALARRDRRPRDTFDAVDDYARFRAAMAGVRSARLPSGGAGPVAGPVAGQVPGDQRS